MNRLLSALALDNPIVRRDGLTRARSWRMSACLVACLSVLGGLALVVFSIAASHPPGRLINSADMADAAFLVMALQLAMVLLFTSALAAASIAGERERQTLDLLVLGEASARRIAWAKVVAALAPVLLFMAGALPFAVAAFSYAGIGMGQLAVVELTTVAGAVAVASLGVLVSARSSSVAAAVVIAVIATVVLWAGTALVGTLGPVRDAASTGRGDESVHLFVFANPFYAANSEVTHRSPSGAHVGRLVQVAVLDTGAPSHAGPVVKPWVLAVLVQAGLGGCCVLLAGRALAGRPLTPFGMPLVRRPQPPRRPRRPRRAGVAVVAFVATVVVPGALSSPSDAAPSGAVSISAGPKWGAVPTGLWTPYSAVVRNDGPADVTGEIVLTPRLKPPAGGGATAAPTTTASTTVTTTAATTPAATFSAPDLVTVGGRPITARPPPLARVGPQIPSFQKSAAYASQFASYRVPVSVPVGDHRTVAVVVRGAPFGYDVDVRDQRGHVLATSPPAPGATRTTALLLSNIQGADLVLEATSSLSDLKVTQPRSVREMPDTAVQLAGLNGIVIDDADTTLLNERQRQALADYVSLGGELVVAGGTAWRPTLGGLPPELVPLRPSATTSASLGPLADLAGATTALTAPVATGVVSAGRVVVGAPRGPPLVVEATYGSGTVTQLSFDPLAEPIHSDPVLGRLANYQALVRIANYRLGECHGTHTSLWYDQLGWSALAGLHGRGWPSWPAWSVWAFVAYALVVVPAALALSRRRRRAGATLAVLVPAALIVATVAFAPSVSHVRQSVVEVRNEGSGGTVLDTVYRAVVGAGPDDEVRAPRGAAVSTLLTGGVLFRLSGPGDGTFDEQILAIPMRGGAGGGAIQAGGPNPVVRFGSAPDDVREVETVAIDHKTKTPSLGGELGLVPSPSPAAAQSQNPGSPPTRLIGSVTNRGSVALRGVRAQFTRAQASIAKQLAPGQTVRVDAPLIQMISGTPSPEPAPADPEDAVAFAAGCRALISKEQVALVATTREPLGRGETRHITAVTSIARFQSNATTPVTAAVEGIDSSLPTLRGVSFGNSDKTVTTFDIATVPGIGPRRLGYNGQVPLEAASRQSIEIYDWTTGAWRFVPTSRSGPDPRYAGLDAPLQPSELNDGLARVRTRTDDKPGFDPTQFFVGIQAAGP